MNFIYLKSLFITWMVYLEEVMGSNPVRAWTFFRSYFQLLVSVVFLAARMSYMRFFTAVQMYEFHISKIIIHHLDGIFGPNMHGMCSYWFPHASAKVDHKTFLETFRKPLLHSYSMLQLNNHIKERQLMIKKYLTLSKVTADTIFQNFLNLRNLFFPVFVFFFLWSP